MTPSYGEDANDMIFLAILLTNQHVSNNLANFRCDGLTTRYACCLVRNPRSSSRLASRRFAFLHLFLLLCPTFKSLHFAPVLETGDPVGLPVLLLDLLVICLHVV